MKGKGILRIMAVALILFLLLLAIPVTPALAALYGTIYISPVSGPPGTLVYVSGTNFTPNSVPTVLWSGVPVSTSGTVSSLGYLNASFYVPTYTRASYPITVTTNATDTSNTVYFTVTPQILLSASSGRVGDQITVSGSSFYTSSTVTIYFDTTAVVTTTATTYGAISATITIPQSYYGVHTIKGTDSLGDSSPLSFTILPKVTVTPTLAAVGDRITISGTGFAASQTVTTYLDNSGIGSTQTDAYGSFSQTNFTVPAGAWGSHTILAQDATGNSGSISFSIKQSTTLTPTSGPINTKVTVTGNGFNANAAVTITLDDIAVATTPAAVTTDASGSFSATFNIPASSGGARQVKISDGTNLDTRTFTVSATISTSPASGYVGAKVTISGTGFLASQSITILFDNALVKTVSSDANGSFSTTFDVPAKGAGAYKIRATDGTNTKDADFTVLTNATISPVTSTSSPGNVGTLLTVNGIGFLAGRALAITYDGTQVATGVVGSDGNFSITFNAPASKAGAHTVTASDGTNSIPITFVMESTAPPVTTLLTPASGTKAKAQASFDWNPVTDPSGVTYTFQIATTQDFTAASIVLQKTGLTQSEYTLTKDEKLKSVSKSNPYFWRVQATDGASNVSNWSTPSSFYVGLTISLPTWAIILLSVLGAVIIFLLGLWLGRRSAAAM